jgi:hypothetical protein
MALGLVVWGVCLAALSGTTLLIGPGSTWRWLKGTGEASAPDTAAWRQLGFGDGGWESGPAPFSYGEGLGSGTGLPDMRGGYTCIFLRRGFEVSDPAGLSALRLHALSDDGFAAWINGVPVARFNMPGGELRFDTSALGAFNEPLPVETYEIADFTQALRPGANVLAVQACNSSLSGSSDFVFEAILEAEVDDVAPEVERVSPAAGSRVRELRLVTVVFSEAVEGVDAADLTLNGVGASSVTEFGGDQYLFEFAAAPAGTARLAWVAGAGIRDRSVAGNPFAGGAWEYVVDPNLPPPGVTISEFMADNNRTLNDGDGDASDWIELENASEEPVDLAGWGLTDDASLPAKWRFGAVSIPARGYLVVFASGKDRAGGAGGLHTNFRLGNEGEYLALTRPDGTVASSFGARYPEQREDVSYGRLATDPTRTGYFVVPTPGGPNAEGGAGFGPDVEFSRVGGTYLSPFMLTLRAKGAGAVVRYTLDGRVPTEASPEAVAPIRIDGSVRVRARTFAPGVFPGRLMAEYYVRLNPSAASATSNLPYVVIHGFGGGSVPPNGEYPAFVSIYEPHGGMASLTNAPDLRTRARVNIRGSSTLFQPKRNYSVEFRDEREADRDLSPLGLPAESDWILYAPNNFEPILIHNPFIYEVSRRAGRYAPRTRFVEVYVQTGSGSVGAGEYAGVYVLMEKIKRGPDRVDVANLEPEHTRPPAVTGGYVMKIDRLDPGDSGMFAAGQSIGFVEPKEEEMRLPQRAPQFEYIRGYVEQFGQALNGANWRDPVTGWRAYVDQGSWIDHHILNVMAFNVDALRLSAYFYKPREGKLHFGPIWDFDRALYSTDGRDINPRIWRSAGGDRGTDFFNYPWWGRLFRDPDFWQAWIDRYQELRRGAFETNALFGLVDEMTGRLRGAQVREVARWPGFTSPRGSYSNEIAQLKFWLLRRINFMDTNFLAAPTPTLARSEAGGLSVTFQGPPGATVYFTTDGTDPRAPGGEIGATAQAASGPIAVGPTGVVRARSRNPQHRNLTGVDNPPITSPWSGPVDVRSATSEGVSPRVLVISEVHGRPARPTTAELAVLQSAAASDFEFVEVWNPGDEAVDLGDLRFSNGIDFAFAGADIGVLAPGARLVVVRNRAAFEARYGRGVPVAGVYGGGLNAAGERLTLVDGLGRRVARAWFRSEAFPTADGLGFALVLRNESAGMQDVGEDDWRVGAVVGGSPGAADPVLPGVPEVRVNELLANTSPPLLDGVELHHPGPGAADIGGWYLSDDRSNPFKYRIPDGTVLPAGGYLWIDESRFNAAPGATTSFRFGADGDEVWLVAADGQGRLTGYVHGFDFGASPFGVSFGRESGCVGREVFLLQNAPTPGAANAGPMERTVMISEVHYRPPDLAVGDDRWTDKSLEFVELVNLSDRPVPLFDSARPGNTWRLADAVTFTFPEGVTLGAGGVLLVVPFDPVANPQAALRFRSSLAVPATVPLYGPFEGALPNDRGGVELARPDQPAADTVQYLLVDRLDYRDEAPWTPLADGTGKSLQRIEWSRPEAGARSWVAALPSPGVVADGLGDADGDGMPDGWEALACLDPNDAGDAAGDLDGDGMANRDEYRVGTDPADSGDVLGWTAAGVDDTGRALFTFRAKAGIRYEVEVTDGLAPGGWQRLREVPAGEERTVVVDDLIGVGPRFYRVQSPGGR